MWYGQDIMRENYFSEKLIIRLQNYFWQKYGIEITAQQADDFLCSFAELFLTFSNK